MDLPAEVVDDLNAIGWRGPLDEVVRYWREDPDRVENLLWYARQKGWGGGLLRNALRSGEWPPELKPGSEADLDRWREEAARLTTSTESTPPNVGDGGVDPKPVPPDVGDEPASATHDLPPEVQRWWEFTRIQLAQEMPKGNFDAYVRPARPVAWQAKDGRAVLTVAAADDYARRWLADRLTKILEHKLTGLAGHPVAVQFVAQEEDAHA